MSEEFQKHEAELKAQYMTELEKMLRAFMDGSLESKAIFAESNSRYEELSLAIKENSRRI